MSLKTIKNGDRAEKAGEDCSGTSSSENPACDDRSSDSTSSNSQILSRSMARRLKKKMKAAKEKKLEVPKAQVEMFRDVKKSMFRSNGMKSKQASSNTVPDDTASASNCIGSGHVVLTDSPPGRVTPASVPPPASACHGRNRESKSELAKLQKGCPCDGQTLKANGSVSVDGVKKDTGEEPSKDIKASGEGKKKKKRKGKGKAKRSQIEIEGPLADGEISDAKVQRKLEGRVGSTAADHVTTNKHVPQQCLNNQGRLDGRIPSMRHSTNP